MIADVSSPFEVCLKTRELRETLRVFVLASEDPGVSLLAEARLGTGKHPKTVRVSTLRGLT